jgi:hypothetical protein
MHRLMGFWRVQIRALRALDWFHLAKPNTFQHDREVPTNRPVLYSADD